MSHDASLELEMAVRRAFGRDAGRGTLLVANADYIDMGFGFAALTGAIAPFYVYASPEEQADISEFLQRYTELNGGRSKDHADLIRQAAKDLDKLIQKLKK
ncbi:hypothetical protein E8L90_03255 [Brevibacillus antibioticus]|uniref:Uncharacterized protein n=1 Tax=Brevibacillus antibioticus TaxID=2570228 RepID=A0A4U2Y291_9BACL|nr:hypothetical protein [Brevibacillus antibioticus]TKI54538.1 hypothetical protein E8L90_03255 [Brevibacillus antibioticus]